MKKTKLLIMLCAFILLVSGCAAKTPEEALKDAYKKTSEVKGLEAALQMKVEVQMGDVAVSVRGNANAKFKVDKKDTLAHFHMNMNVMEEMVDLEVYLQKLENQLTAYLKDETGWTKETTTLEENTTPDLKKDITFDEVKKLSEEKGVVVYEAVVKRETLEKAIQEVKDAIASETEDFNMNNLQLYVNDVTMKFTVQDKLITKVEFSMPVGFQIMVEEKPQMMNLHLEMTADLSKHNQVEDITIPSDALEESATNELKDHMQTYAYMAGMDMIFNDLKGTYTKIDLTKVTEPETKEVYTYDGPKPTKVELKLDDEYNLSGFVEMEGYHGVIENDEITTVTKLDA